MVAELWWTAEFGGGGTTPGHRSLCTEAEIHEDNVHAIATAYKIVLGH